MSGFPRFFNPNKATALQIESPESGSEINASSVKWLTK